MDWAWSRALPLGRDVQLETGPDALVARTRWRPVRLAVALPFLAAAAFCAWLPFADAQVVPLPAKIGALPAALALAALSLVVLAAREEVRVTPGRVRRVRTLGARWTREWPLRRPEVRLARETRPAPGARDDATREAHVVRVREGDVDLALLESDAAPEARRAALALARVLGTRALDAADAPVAEALPPERSLAGRARAGLLRVEQPAAPLGATFRLEPTESGARVVHRATRPLFALGLALFGLAFAALGLAAGAFLALAIASGPADLALRLVLALFLLVPLVFVAFGVRAFAAAASLLLGRLEIEVARGRLVCAFRVAGMRWRPHVYDLWRHADLRWDARKGVVLDGPEGEEVLSLPVGPEEGRWLAQALRFAIARHA